jgi:SpoIVB peptidase S55
VIVALALTGSGALLAQTRGVTAGTMSVDEIRPGMRGYGLTVFRGVRPERFDVEVIDVLHNFRPRQDLVLIRPSHPQTDHAGVVGGMSGSPIYLNDRLIGAYAYGWEFGRDPVAGVTPIASMRAELQRPRRTPAGLMPGWGTPVDLVPRSARRALPGYAESLVAQRDPVQTAWGALAPVAAPLSVSGMGARALRALTAAFAPYDVVPVQAGGSGPSQPPSDLPPRFEAGAAVGVQIMSGDISGVVTGTVTSAGDEGVLGFGHPMVGLGETLVPAVASRVLWILASERRSFKISEPVAPRGALVQDRPSCVVVDERATAPTVPVRVRITGVDGIPQGEWNVRVAAHRAFGARLALSVLETALESAVGDLADAAWTLRSTVNLRGYGPVSFSHVGSSADGSRAVSAGLAGELVTRAMGNAFDVVPVDGVEFELAMRWSREFAYVRSVAATQAEVEPGAELELRVALGRYGAPEEVRTVRLRIPRELEGRDAEIEVMGGAEAVPELPEPESVGDLIRNLRTDIPNDALVVALRMPGQGVTLRGRVIESLPGSALDLLRPAASTESGEPLMNWRRTVIPVGRVVIGRDRLRVRVREVRS